MAKKKVSKNSNGVRLCITKDCDKTARVRGLCHVHFKILEDMVNEGLAEWEELEEKGLALPRQRRRVHEHEFRKMVMKKLGKDYA
jgi:hypothetical protein